MAGRFRVVGAMLATCACGFSVALPARPVLRRAQTQGEMNVAAAREYHLADAELNRAYKRLVEGSN